MMRADDRKAEQLRRLTITPHIFDYADGSVLFEQGKTKILCAVTRSKDVPIFLRGKGQGWLTAEYAMLPASTPVRSPRETSLARRNGRVVEISRFIGRALRCVTDLKNFGEYTVTIDCDVLQADGSTRCAAICAAQAALNVAVTRWLEAGIIKKSILITQIAAVSVGLEDGGNKVLLDLDAGEDNGIGGDFNFVLTHDNEIVEVQGTAEQGAISWQKFDAMCELATAGTKQINNFIAVQTNPVLQR
jgi:ribonuclease PH